MRTKYSIGIGINLFSARAIILREDGKVITEIKKKRTKTDANETLNVVLELCQAISAKGKKYKKDITAIGLAIGGIVNTKKGIVYWPQERYSYVGMPLKEYLQNKFGFPVVLENDANSCAWAEYKINYSKYKNLIYMFSGVGCGMVLDSKLYKGKDGSSGEFFLNFQKVMNTSLGDFSFLRQWPYDFGMVKRAKESISQGAKSSLIKKISSSGDLALSDIFKEAKAEDLLAKSIIKEAAGSLSVKIAFLINLLNPEAVVIGGGIEAAGTSFLDFCLRDIKKLAFSEMRKSCKVSLSGLGQDATSLGAAMLALNSHGL